MDDFGVLVQTYGIRPQGKSAPMAASKTAPGTHSYSQANQDPFSSIKSSSKSTHNSNSGNGSLLDDQNDVFGFGFNHKPQNYASVDVFDDVFQMPTKSSNGGGSGGGLDFDMEAMFKGSMNLNSKSLDVDDNVIWGFSEKVSSKVSAGNGGDLLSSDPMDDFLGNLSKMGSGSSSRSDGKGRSKVEGDDLISGFGSNSARHHSAQASSTEKSAGLSSIDELQDFGSGKMKKKNNGNLGAFKIKIEPKKISKPESVETTFINIEGSFHGNGIFQNNMQSVSQNFFETEAPDLDSFFGAHSQKSKSVEDETDSRSTRTADMPDLFSGTPFSTNKKVSPGNSHDDFSLLFGDVRTSTEFEEIEGESEERRKARLGHYQTTQARMAQALADLNQREFRAQQEQEERHRISEAMDIEMKRWAAGKEGNLRALLSSLQQVLAPELGWKVVTLTDLITSSQVKLAYKKAALCVHPDKVQQKGANLQQKYVAEKVFDLLKEAWNKFNSEELR